MAEQQASKEIDDKKKEAESLLILGLFSMVVGAVLFISILVTDTANGRIANFLVGLVLFVGGILVSVKGKRDKKKLS